MSFHSENPNPLIYLGTPYWHENPKVRKARFKKASRAAGELMSIGFRVYSPISHSHVIAQLCKLPNDWEFWQKQCLSMLALCDVLVVLQLKGWDRSVGLRAEINFAQERGMSMYYMEEKKEDDSSN